MESGRCQAAQAIEASISDRFYIDHSWPGEASEARQGGDVGYRGVTDIGEELLRRASVKALRSVLAWGAGAAPR